MSVTEPTNQFEQTVRDASDIISSEEISEEKYREAESKLEWALTVDRHNPGVVFLLSSLYLRVGRRAMAEHWTRYFLTMTPDFGRVEALNNLGFIVNQDGDIDEAARFFNEALALEPDNVAVINNVATSKINNGTPELGVEWCEKVLAIEPNHADALWNRALCLLEMGKWREGWEGYKAGLTLTDMYSSAQRKKRHYVTKDATPYWEGTADKSVVLYGEQGVGDEIMAVSMLPDAIERGSITLEAHPRLVDIYRHSFGDKIPIYGTRKMPWDSLTFTQWTDIQAKLPVLGLGGIFRNDAADFPRTPYLRPYQDKVEHYGNVLADLSPRSKIGFSWKGGTPTTRSDLRSIPLEAWQLFFERFRDVDWVSLQYDPANDHGHNSPIVHEFEEKTGIVLNHNPAAINDLDECYGGLIHALDMVISVNTSLVHACGAFGVPCMVLTPSKPAWRYGQSGVHMPWYGDHVTQYRQEGDEWDDAMGRLADDLEKYLSKEEAA